ncbi:TIGR02680 family protein [Nocardia salmonicida]|uniref:TIGR02680 family protein n=1 Tax=Nocardia salmonicida TaxID=53431 RepID=UPI0037B4A9CB
MLSGAAPTPTSTRFKPLRIGLVGIWQYSNEQFNFHDGRLILRGRNGSGKTKVLEVTSPFLLDANLSARRLDPFGSNARSMRDNLLSGGRTHQIGYVWCEYGRITETGDTEYRTIGAGMRARENKSGAPEPWYFLTPHRVGRDFDLCDHADRPLSQDDLAAKLGTHAVFAGADPYRAALARDLFGLSPERMKSLVELLITLRRPKLSENLGVGKLAEILSNGLPPIDADRVADLAKNFDELTRDQEDLQRFVKTRNEVDHFLQRYRIYARRMTKHITEAVVEAAENHRKVVRRSNSAKTELEKLEIKFGEVDAVLSRLEREQDALGGQITAIEGGPEMRNQRELARLQGDVEDAVKRAATAEQSAVDASGMLMTAQQELGEVDGKLSTVRDEVSAAAVGAQADALAAGLEYQFAAESDRLNTDTAAAQHTLQTYVATRRKVVEQTRRLQRAQQGCQSIVDRAQGTHDDLSARQAEAQELVRNIEATYDEQVNLLSQEIVSWSGRNTVCRLSDDSIADLIRTVEAVEIPDTPRLASLINQHFETTRTTLLDQRSQLRTNRNTLESERRDTQAQRERVASGYDQAPPDPIVARRDRTGTPGAPLWRLIDFRPELEDRAVAAVEGALLGAGLLDAWVTPDGFVLDPQTWDAVVVPGRARSGPTLADLVVAVEYDDISESVITEILAGIGIIDDEAVGEPATPWISPDGRWAIGPLRGRTGQEYASYIGQSARDAARNRALVLLDTRIDALTVSVSGVENELLEMGTRLAALAEEERTQPIDSTLRDVLSDLAAARKHHAQLREDLAKSLDRLRIVREPLGRATEDLRSYAATHRTPTKADQLDAALVALADLSVSVERLVGKIGAVQLLAEQFDSASERVSLLLANNEKLTEQSKTADTAAVAMRADLEERIRLGGSEIEETLARLAEVRQRLGDSERSSKTYDAEQQARRERRAVLYAEIEGSRDEVERLLGLREAGLAQYRRVRERGFIELADVTSADSSTAHGDIEEAARVRALLAADDSDEAARNIARNDVDHQFRQLQREIDGSEWHPWGDNDGDLFVVRVTTVNGVDYALPQLRALIVDEIETRGTYVEDRERRLFSDVLLGSMGEHLRERRLEARKLVQQIDEQLGRHPTASKMLMSIKWEPSEKVGAAVRNAINLLDRGSTQFLAADAREALIGFLTEQVREARDRAEHGDWKAHLAEALDYRRWSEFELRLKLPDSPRPVVLTDELHRRGSGGEKAVMLQLPMFAAAAAHYAGAAATAPRPIYLDEAFAGIDAEMRGSCIGLLTDFDLDFVMASHDEWGFHSSVPGVMTYQLYRDPTIFGVLATPIVWDGKQRHTLQDRSLDYGPPPSILDDDDDDDDE